MNIWRIPCLPAGTASDNQKLKNYIQMKKSTLILSAFIAMVFFACGPESQEKKSEDTLLKADSMNEQKNLDSLFNAANNNVDSAKDSSIEKK